MLKKLTLTALIFLLFITSAAAAKIVLHNDTEHVLFASVIWTTCDWEGWDGTCTVSQATMYPNKEPYVLNSDRYKPGEYYITWECLSYDLECTMPDQIFKEEITSDKGVLESTPSGIKFTPGI